jgi:hypothetical protein
MDIMNAGDSGIARELAMHLSLVSNIVIIMTERCAMQRTNHQAVSNRFR